MSTLRRDRLLVSSVNGGGVFLVHGNRVERLSSIDTSGLARCADGAWLFARQDELSNELRRVAGAAWSSHEIAPHVLDLHDVLVHEGHVYAVATEINAVLQLDPTGMRELRRWSLDGEPDSSHVNSICVYQGRLLASRFGEFRTHRGYKGVTVGAGEVYDVETGEVVITGLSQPHSLTARGEELWVCDSEAGCLRCYRGFTEVRSVDLDGYVRGLAFGQHGIHVGLSRSRNERASRADGATVVTLDPETLRPAMRTALPVDEVYDIRVVDDDLAQLREAAVHETTAELARQREARRRAEASAVEGHAAARALADALHQANLRLAALEAGDEEEAARVGMLERTAADDAAWARLLEDEVGRLQDMLDRQSRELASAEAWMAAAASIDARLRGLAESRAEQLRAASAALDEKDAYIRLITGSRRWRFTSWLGAWPAAPTTPAPPPDNGMPAPLSPPVPAAVERDQRAGPRRAMLPVSGLAFAVPPAPRVSVVVTGCARYTDTLGCLLSLQAAGGSTPLEVIAVGSGAADDELQRFRSVAGLRWIEVAGGDGAACAGANASTGEFIAFVDARTRVGTGWVDALLATFPIFPECGMVAPRVLSSDGRLYEAGRIVWADGSSSRLGMGEAPDDDRYGVVREVDRVAGAAFLVRAAPFREIGGFDAGGLCWEDAVADLGFRMRAGGHCVRVQPAAVVVRSTDALEDVEAAGERAASREGFVARWRDVLAREHWPAGEQPFLARDRAQLKRTVLVIDHRAPEPDRDAGSRAIWHLLRVLHVFGFSVKFWAVSAGDDPRYALGLRVHGFELLDEQHNGPLDAWLQDHGPCVDHVVLSRPMVAWACIDAVRRHSGASVLYYGHDIHHQRLQRQYEVSREEWLPPHIAHVRGVEEALWRACDLVLYPTEEETRHVRAWLSDNASGRGRAETIALFAYESLHAPVPGPEARRDVVFVGSYEHAPNEDGAYWFAREVWPLIRQVRGDLRLCLIGAGATERLRSLAAADIVFAGAVDEATLSKHYDAARVTVAPLRFGAGLKGKIVEAMRHGVPCVTTTTGAQGLQPARFLQVADTAEAMAAKVLEAAGDDAGWRLASEDAQAYVARRFSVHAVWDVLQLAMDNAPYRGVEERRLRIAANRGHERGLDDPERQHPPADPTSEHGTP